MQITHNFDIFPREYYERGTQYLLLLLVSQIN